MTQIQLFITTLQFTNFGEAYHILLDNGVRMVTKSDISYFKALLLCTKNSHVNCSKQGT